MRNWRKMTWALIIWSGLIIAWMIGAGTEADCAGDDACEAGTGIGIALVALIGFFGFAFLTMIWFMTRPRGRACPRCGELVKKGQMTCKSCGFDFDQLGRQSPSA